MKEEPLNFNLNRYSRQIGTYGVTAMQKLSKMKIFIYGMRGMGIEVSKNILLAGAKEVTIYDNKISQINDLSSNFYINENDVIEKKRRDEASFSKLSKLNPSVILNIMQENSILLHLKKNKYDVIVITEFLDKEIVIELNNYCRENNIGFIYGTELGITGFCFVDFGDNFIVQDKYDSESKDFIIDNISKSNPGIVHFKTPINFEFIKENDYVIFSNIQGMIELNNIEPIQIKIKDNKNLIILCDTSNFSDYISGGIMKRAIIPLKLNFESFEKKIEEPYDENNYPIQIDYSNPNTNEILHIGHLALYEFYKEKKSLPELNNFSDSEKIFQLAKNIYEKKLQQDEYWLKDIEEEEINFEELFEKTIKNLSRWAKAQISPICSFLGGIIAQEAIKFTGKYIPIKQWFYFNFSETVENLNENINRNLKGTRYDDQIAIFGNEIQKKLENSNIFMIGAGALGCEFLKTFSSMGISTAKNKKLTVTDNDIIVESNLTRQFLFGDENINQYKSIIACKEISKLNKNFNYVAYKKKLGKDTEDLFDQKFWENQNFIINAVDNVAAREYINSQCLLYQKILIDSGTKGTKANSQVIIPNKTTHYIAPKEENDRQIPMCLLHGIPTSIEHCIEWAKDIFKGYFDVFINDLKIFVENKNKFYNELEKQSVIKNVKLKKIIRCANAIIDKDFYECVKIAFEEYINHFSANFDLDNKLTLIFIKSFSKILAETFSIPILKIIDDEEKMKLLLNEIKPLFKIDEKEKNESDEKYKKYIIESNKDRTPEEKLRYKKAKAEEIKNRLKKESEELTNLKKQADKLNLSKIQKNIEKIIKIQEFEKDNDLHLNFIFSASNLRAEIYKIEKCSKIKTQLIAGKIIPAIASSTASIVGLVSLQLYTLYQTNDINFLRNHHFNLARMTDFCFSSPVPCISTIDKKSTLEEGKKYVPEKYTIWDYIVIKESMNIKEFIDYVKKNFGVDVNEIKCDKVNILDDSINIKKIMKKKLEQIYIEKGNIKIARNKKLLVLNVSGKIDNCEALMPLFKYNF